MSQQLEPPFPGAFPIPNFARAYCLTTIPLVVGLSATNILAIVGYYDTSLRPITAQAWSFSSFVGCVINCDHAVIPNGATFWALAGLPAAPGVEPDELFKLVWRLET